MYSLTRELCKFSLMIPSEISFYLHQVSHDAWGNPCWKTCNFCRILRVRSRGILVLYLMDRVIATASPWKRRVARRVSSNPRIPYIRILIRDII